MNGSELRNSWRLEVGFVLCFTRKIPRKARTYAINQNLSDSNQLYTSCNKITLKVHKIWVAIEWAFFTCENGFIILNACDKLINGSDGIKRWGRLRRCKHSLLIILITNAMFGHFVSGFLKHERWASRVEAWSLLDRKQISLLVASWLCSEQ